MWIIHHKSCTQVITSIISPFSLCYNGCNLRKVPTTHNRKFRHNTLMQLYAEHVYNSTTSTIQFLRLPAGHPIYIYELHRRETTRRYGALARRAHLHPDGSLGVGVGESMIKIKNNDMQLLSDQTLKKVAIFDTDGRVNRLH